MNRLRLQEAELGQTVTATQQLAEEEAALEAELRGAQAAFAERVRGRL